MSTGEGQPPRPTLPARAEAAEDAFVAQLRDNPADSDALIAAIDAAIDARRPQLAARLFQLLDDQLEVPPGSALDRARQASRLLVARPEPATALHPDETWAELEQAWREARRGRMDRILRRWRQSLTGDTRRIGRFDKGRSR